MDNFDHTFPDRVERWLEFNPIAKKTLGDLRVIIELKKRDKFGLKFLETHPKRKNDS